MTILLFVSYEFRNSVMGFSQGSMSNVWVLESPADFLKHMKELTNGLKQHHDSDVVIIKNIAMQEWKE